MTFSNQKIRKKEQMNRGKEEKRKTRKGEKRKEGDFS